MPYIFCNNEFYLHNFFVNTSRRSDDECQRRYWLTPSVQNVHQLQQHMIKVFLKLFQNDSNEILWRIIPYR